MRLLYTYQCKIRLVIDHQKSLGQTLIFFLIFHQKVSKKNVYISQLYEQLILYRSALW